MMLASRHVHLLSVVFLLLLAFVSAGSDPLSYCKCTCGTHSLIIPLDPDAPKPLTCLDCNRSFCRTSNLNICDGAKEEEMSTTCFQRDSVKDQAVVLIFIISTVCLLIYAAVKPWVSKWIDPQGRSQPYEPLPAQ